jgi:NAD(P)H-flavin reductase
MHVPLVGLPRLYLCIALGVFSLTSAAEGLIVLRNSVVFKRTKDNKGTKVGEIFKYPGDDDKSPVQLTILLKKPLEMDAGQYINICIPTLGRVQSRPFAVVSWTGKQQKKLDLVIEPRRGWTKRLHSRALTASGQNGGLHRVFFTGPHGIPVPVGRYEYILMIASGYGIIAHLPLLERLVQGALAHEVRARRIRLVWEFDDIGKLTAARRLRTYTKSYRSL